MENKKKPDFTREDGWPDGLYLRSSGTFYSRYSLNGERTYRSLETESFAVAKLKHAKRMAEIEEARQKGTTINGDLRSMGALARLLEKEVSYATIAQGTKTNYLNWLERLKKNWPGDFETCLAKNVNRDFVVELRTTLESKAAYKVVNTNTEKKGYKPAVVNQSLSMLNMLLKLAAKNHVIFKNPFEGEGVIQQSLYLPKKHKVPELPSTEDMERIFAEMARVDESKFNLEDSSHAGRLRYLQEQAHRAAEHARFLAYSGMRLKEANRCEIKDDLGDFIVVRGTKTESADRKVPVIPALRGLLDLIKTRKIAGPILDVSSSRQALQRACKRLGLPRLTHHHLRHYFITVCIENGASIPAVADWVGHCDGGTLLLETYRHLRDKHSLEEAKKVNFGSDLSSLAKQGSTPALPGSCAC